MIHKINFGSFIILVISLLLFISCGDEEIKPDDQKVEEPITTEMNEDSVDNITSTLTEENIKSTETTEDIESSELPSSYIVQEGETLESIAEKFYGNSGDWFQIFAENESKIDNWNHVYPGQELKLPEK